jgi:hypothetical protein
MAKNEVHKNDVGTVFEFTVKDGSVVVDLSAATISVKFRKPNGTVLTKTGVLLNDGTDGKMKYTTVLNDLSDAGDWSVQAVITIGTGTWNTDIQHFRVFDNLS